ncbi:Hint domain-containing protein [Roseovarius tolerans]|uniref:Hint domain-containing protein n=1 Tax=Roseovarius tolerans TaxID=74031 RepID=A0A1H8ELF1_9RHOB|nr:Hint domain-containing protein [Roseovarius tolerans]SEN20226.1 Hint domain-containing protein [Roseovarius tolerans]
MGWIAVTDHDGGHFMPQGLGAPQSDREVIPDASDLMARGTLMIETRPAMEPRPQTLLSFSRSHPWHGGFSLQALPSGGISLIETQAGDVRHATLPYRLDDRTDSLRITYSWDAPARWGRLSVERPEVFGVASIALPPPHPIPLSDMRTIFTDPRQRQMDRDVIFAALSSRIEPVGPMPGLSGSVPVLTPGGYVAVGRLKRADKVLTTEGAPVPVLQSLHRRVPAFGSFRPVRLRAHYFGLRRDIVVAPHQRLVIRGSEVEYLFNSEAVLVPARHLVNGFSALFAESPTMVSYHNLLLPGHEELDAAGTQTESLYVGRLRRKPDMVGLSVLAGCDRARLPEHPKPLWPVLKPYEAITLAMNRAA